MDEAFEYAFPHSAVDESRRLELFQQRLDPLTIRRIERLAIGRGAKCLEIGGGRGSITRWLSERIGPDGWVTATDLQPGFLDAIDASNVEVRRGRRSRSQVAALDRERRMQSSGPRARKVDPRYEGRKHPSGDYDWPT